MTVSMDPEGRELLALRRATEMSGTRVLEIGSGEGRLALQLAPGTAHTIGIDPGEENVARAQARCPEDLKSTLAFVQSDAMALPFRDHTFDRAIFGWSL